MGMCRLQHVFVCRQQSKLSLANVVSLAFTYIILYHLEPGLGKVPVCHGYNRVRCSWWAS